MKKLLTWLFVFIPLFTGVIFSQNNTSSGIKIDISGGYAHSLYNKGSFQFGEYSRGGISGSLRVIWQSEYLLGIGFETGYIPLASLKQDNFTNEFGTSDIKANINAIPILADFQFNFGKFFASTSAGYYYINSRINAFGLKSLSSTFDFGFSFSLGYRHMFDRKFGIGTELKSHHMVDTPQLAFILQVMFICNISEF